MASPRSRFLSVLLISAAAAMCAWVFLPSSPVDRWLLETTARSSANPPFIISGKGSAAEPWSLRLLAPYQRADASGAPQVISLGDDPDGVFQATPPSPVDLAVILKNMRRLGATHAAIAAILAWDKPDVIGLAALDGELGRFPSLVTAAPLARAANTDALPPGFRRASLPLERLHGDSSLLPAVNRVSLPGIILGGGSTALCGFSILEHEENESASPLIARWDDRAVFAFPLIAILARRGIPVESLEIELGNYIKLGDSGIIIPIDEYGRLAAPLPSTAGRATIPAETLIDRSEALDPQATLLLRDDQSAAEAATRAFSRKAAPLITALSSGAGMAAERTYRRPAAAGELALLAGAALILAGCTVLRPFPRQLAFGAFAALIIIAQFTAAGGCSLWLPALPALAATLAAFTVAGLFFHQSPEASLPAPAPISPAPISPAPGPASASPAPVEMTLPGMALPETPAKKTAAKKTAAKKAAPHKKAPRPRKGRSR